MQHVLCLFNALYALLLQAKPGMARCLSCPVGKHSKERAQLATLAAIKTSLANEGSWAQEELENEESAPPGDCL